MRPAANTLLESNPPAKKPELAEIVGDRVSADWHKAPNALKRHRPQRHDHHVGARITEGVDDSPCDHAPAREGEIDLLNQLALAQLNQAALFEWSCLTV